MTLIEILKILIPYLAGLLVATLLFHPVKAWNDGYNDAKEFYNDWSDGFNTGFKRAEKTFKDYDEGFGAGFECGWNAALNCQEQEDV